MKSYFYSLHSLFIGVEKHIKAFSVIALLSYGTTVSFIVSSQTLSDKKYHVEEVSAQPYVSTIKRIGKVMFKRTVNLSFKTSGYLAVVNVDEGDLFTEKQLLASLDTAELNESKNATYALLLQAKRNVSRLKKLLVKKSSSQQELDVATTTVETTRADYRVAVYNLKKAQVYAPFNGVVVTRDADLGELQYPNKIALQVAALENNLIVKAALTGEEISLVTLNQRVLISLNHSNPIEGYISKIPAIADRESNLFNIEVLLPSQNTLKTVIAGQIAQIEIQSSSQDFVYRLPIAALNGVNKQGKALISLQDKGQLTQQAYDIYKIDNNYLYLYASETVAPLSVVTQGWQHFSLNGNE